MLHSASWANLLDHQLMGIRPFFAIRHGETEWNRAGRFQGHGNAPLTDMGRAQVAECAAILRQCHDRFPIQPFGVAVYSSPLSRAVQSAEILCRALDIDAATITIDDRLRETSFGAWEGMSTQEVKAAFPAERKMRKANRWEFAPPGGESIAMAARAMANFFEELVTDGMPVLVSHSGNIRALHHLLGGLDRIEAVLTEIPHNSVYHWDGSSLHRHHRLATTGA